MPLSILKFKKAFFSHGASSHRQILSILSDRLSGAIAAAGAASTPADLAAFNIVRNLTANMNPSDMNSVSCPSAFVWTQLLESESAALAEAINSVLSQL